MTTHPSATQRGPLIAGVLTAVLVFLIPLMTITALGDSDPEVRIIDTRGRLSALIVDGETRIAVVDVPDREVALAALGRLSRPWEPPPHMLISPADDRAAVGLWEVLQHTSPQAVAVVGVPGSEPLWQYIESLCERRGIPLTFVVGDVAVETSRLTLHITAPDIDRPAERGIRIVRGDSDLTFVFDGPLIAEPTLLVTANPTIAAGMETTLVLTNDTRTRNVRHDEILIGTREVVRIRLEESTIRIVGGTHRGPSRPDR